MNTQQTYQRPFILSVILHVFVLIVLMLQLNFTTRLPSQTASAPVQPIKAVAVNSSQVAAQVAKLKAEQQAKQQAELLKQKQLAEQAAAAKRQRELEQQRLAQLKAEAQKLAKQREAQAKAEAQELAQLKAQQTAEQKRLSELAKQQQAQEAKQKQLKQQQEAKQKALEQKQKAEQQRKAEEDKLLQQQLAAEQQRLEQDQLRAQQQSVIDEYKAKILMAISQQWIVPENMPKDIISKLLIQVGPGGVVLDVKLVQSSGNSVLDRSAIAAVRKASPLPVPADANLLDEFREINLLVRPEGVTQG